MEVWIAVNGGNDIGVEVESIDISVSKFVQIVIEKFPNDFTGVAVGSITVSQENKPVSTRAMLRTLDTSTHSLCLNAVKPTVKSSGEESLLLNGKSIYKNQAL